MNAEKFIEENYFGLKIDCQRDIQTIYQALEDYANEQLRLYGVSNRREQLIAFLRQQSKLHYITIYENDFEFADKLLKAINCC